MKILYFSGTKLPSQNAQSVHCMKMAEAFARAGHDVTLFAKGALGAEIPDIFEAYNTEKNFKIELLNFVNVPLLSGAVRWVDMSGKIRRSAKPDLVYGADPVALALLCPSGAKIIYEALERPKTSSKHWAFLKLMNHKNFKALIVTSKILRQEFLDKYPALDADKIFVAYNGADDAEKAQNKILPTLKGKADAFKIGYIGSLHAEKGINLIAEIAELRPEYEFHIIGGTQRHIQKIQSNYFLNNLHFYGHRNHADIPAYLKKFNVTIAPYQNNATSNNFDIWHSAVKIFEYMAAKKTILCSDLPVLRETLHHKINAFLLPPEDAKCWARTLDQLCAYPKMAAELAEKAHQDFLGKYTWDKRAENILALALEKPEIFRHAKAS